MEAKNEDRLNSSEEFKPKRGSAQHLETNLEYLLRPCQRALVDYWPRPKPARMDPFFTGTNKPERLWQRIVYAGPDPEELCATGQLNELLSEHIRQLPPPIRDALQLYFLKGLSAVDTCHVLGIGNAALKGRIFRGRRMADALRPTLRRDQTLKTWSIRQNGFRRKFPETQRYT